MKLRMHKCKEITELISYRNEHKIGFLQECAIKMHTFICPYCLAFKKNNDQIRHLMRQFKQEDQ